MRLFTLFTLIIILLSCGEEGESRNKLITEHRDYFIQLSEDLKDIQPVIKGIRLDSTSRCEEIPDLNFDPTSSDFNADFLCEDRIKDWDGSYGEGLGDGQVHFVPSMRLVWTMRTMLDGPSQYDMNDKYFSGEIEDCKNIRYLLILNRSPEFIDYYHYTMDCHLYDVLKKDIICGFRAKAQSDKNTETYVEVTLDKYGQETSNRGVVSSSRTDLTYSMKNEIKRILKEEYGAKFKQ